jgi:hypothetical protein
MDEQTTSVEKVTLNLLKIGEIFQDMGDPDAQAVLVFGGKAYCIDMQLLTNRLLKYNSETLLVTDMEWFE